MTKLKIALIGAGGRMGQAIQTVLAERADMALAGRVGRANADALDDIIAASDCVIDFAAPGQTVRHATAAARAGKAYLVGTTGLDDAAFESLGRAAQSIPILQSYNTSLGVNLLAALVEQAARALGPDWDIEILEMHHRMKADAPSGTAILLGEAAARGRGMRLKDQAVYAREGITGPRASGAIGFAALRGGTVIGDHDVIFAGAEERLTLSHKAQDRRIFARGAVVAAAWLARQKPRLYRMADMLGL